MTLTMELAILGAAFLAFLAVVGGFSWFGLRKLGPFDEKE